ncbi:MAG: hypothetical protein F9K48_09500 [Candidatus Brocadia sp.]|nr:MAG: hypothetical protein F9K48_09500 [Candidatus Brocadia sp.]
MSGVNNYTHTYHCEGDSKKQTSCDSHANKAGNLMGLLCPVSQLRKGVRNDNVPFALTHTNRLQYKTIGKVPKER